jgi:quinol monooxygenase YgiN
MAERVVLIVRFVPKLGKYADFRDHLFTLVEKMSREPDFVNTMVHDDLENPDQLVLYEIWSGNKERWLHEQPPKVYRAEYEARLSELLERRDITWLTPIREWGSGLTGV